jgi:hypothetical protein
LFYLVFFWGISILHIHHNILNDFVNTVPVCWLSYFSSRKKNQEKETVKKHITARC